MKKTKLLIAMAAASMVAIATGTVSTMAWYSVGTFTPDSGTVSQISVKNNTPAAVNADCSHKFMLNGDDAEYAADATQVSGKELLISVLATDRFVNKIHYGENDDRLSGTVGITAVVLEASTTGVDQNDVATYSLEAKVTYTGGGTVKYYTSLSGGATAFGTKDGSTYTKLVTSTAKSDLSAKAWIFVDGTTEITHTNPSALIVEYRVVINPAA